jgi:hypothetical protein
MMRTPSLAALASLLATAAAAQQNLVSQGSIVGGAEYRSYSFGDNFSADLVSQVALPVGFIMPIGDRFSFDVGTAYASTRVEQGGSHATYQHFTDTQLRASYIIGNDMLVASVMVNLPTGEETTSLRDFNISSSVSSNFLLFPVNSYGSGFSVTPGLAAATTAGSWNLGVAGSVRWNDEFQPFSDSGSTSLRYQPGLEGRFRVGADRLLGSSRLTLGATFSTFGTDEARGGGLASSGRYTPGNRFLVDVSLMAPVGGGTMSFYIWDFYRNNGESGDTVSTSANNSENILTAGAGGAFRLGQKLVLEPVAETRLWSPDRGNGFLVGGGTNLRIAVNERVAIVPGARFDLGNIEDPTGVDHSVTGWSVLALLRVGLGQGK